MARRKRKKHRHDASGLLSQVARPFKRSSPPGATPGVVDVPEDAVPPKITIVHYGRDFFEEGELKRWEQLSEVQRAPHIVWRDVDGLGSAEAIRRIGEVFGLHPLALEDVAHVHQRAKVEDYVQHLFIVVRMPEFDEKLETEQLSIFLGKNYVITFQEGRPGDCLEPVRQRLRQARGALRGLGADHLAYALVDAVIDSYFPIVELYGDRLDDLDARLSLSDHHLPLGEIHQVRSELLLLRRAVWPHREAVSHLLREQHALITPETRVYLRDCYDHTLQIIDVVETYREMCADLREFQMSVASQRANEIMKVLTIISTIFIPISFIAGVYGMNFEYMPELKWRMGYWMALGLMGVTAMGLVTFVWRRGWFKG